MREPLGALYTESKGTQTIPTLFSTHVLCFYLQVFDDPMPASLGMIRLEKSSACLVRRTEPSPASALALDLEQDGYRLEYMLRCIAGVPFLHVLSGELARVLKSRNFVGCHAANASDEHWGLEVVVEGRGRKARVFLEIERAS